MSTATATVWVRASAGFWRSECGRFDVMHVSNVIEPFWVAYDTERPKKRAFLDLKATQAWCEQRARAHA